MSLTPWPALLESISCTEEEAFGKVIIVLYPQFKPGIVPQLGKSREGSSRLPSKLFTSKITSFSFSGLFGFWGRDALKLMHSLSLLIRLGATVMLTDLAGSEI